MVGGVIGESRKWLACDKCVNDHLVRGALASAPARGWAGRGLRNPILMFVATNPGHPLPAEPPIWRELGVKRGRCVSIKSARAIVHWCTRVHEQGLPGRNGIYHRKLALLARALLHLADRPSDERTWLDSCWLTDAVKCSTERELGGVGRKMADNCRLFLQDEIKAVEPAVLIALGNGAERWLHAAAPRIPIVRFRHPSNGCPRLTSTTHDEAFGQVLRTLRSLGLSTRPLAYAKSAAFMRVREALVARPK